MCLLLRAQNTKRVPAVLQQRALTRNRDVFLEKHAFRHVQPRASIFSEMRFPLPKPTLKNLLIDTHSWPALAGARFLAGIVISVNWSDAGLQPAPQLPPSPPFYLNQIDYSVLARMRRKCKVHMSLWKLPQVSQFGKILVLYGRHSLNSLLAKSPIVFLWEFPFAGVWKDSAFDTFLLKSNCHSHWGTRCWPCVWKVHYIVSRLVCKTKILFFLKVTIQKKLFKKILHWSIIFVFHKMSALLLFGNFDEKELRVDNLSEV